MLERGRRFSMLYLLDNVLKRFRPAFRYEATFHWFILVILGFIIRFDHAGVTSLIRWLFFGTRSL